MLSTELSERQLLDALPVRIFALDLDGHVTSVHSPVTKSADDNAPPPALADARGTLIWNALGGSISRERAESGMRLLRTGHASVVRWELDRAPDEHRATLAQMTPIHDDAHAVTAFVVSTIDITSLDRTREAIEESAVALSRPIDVDHACQVASHQLRRVMRADCVVIALCGDDGPMPRIVVDYGTDDDRRTTEQRFASSWRSAIDTERLIASRSESAITMTLAIPGSLHPVGVVTVVADDDIASAERLGDVRRYFTSVVTQLGSAIERAHDVADAVRKRRGGAIGEVAAGVAHELRNPIFGISSAAQLLRFRAREDPVMETNVGRILREVERLNRMVTTLLDIGRPIALKLTPTDPDTIWDDVLESERGRLESRAIAIRRTKSDTTATIPIDGEQLAQVFKSILSNAVDAAPEATDITLQSAILPSGTWRCRLTNAGPPIPPDMLPRVFELFLSTKPGSTGVGLALAQRIIEEHHGAITIESAAETGTTVTVSLPNTPRTASMP
jgi:signal transduction histidine kinase